eukprot:scaffold49042_cov70-Phaeocystis_antarctica.AAC.1
MRTLPKKRARSAQEAGKRALNLWGSKANQACILRFFTHASPSPPAHLKLPLDHRAASRLCLIQPQGRTGSARATLCSHSRPVVPRLHGGPGTYVSAHSSYRRC